MTPLRQRMVEDLQLRNRSKKTIAIYTGIVSKFARFHGRSPEKLGPEEVRTFLLHMIGARVLLVLLQPKPSVRCSSSTTSP